METMSRTISLFIGSTSDDFIFTDDRATIAWGRAGNDVIEDAKADGTVDLGWDRLWGNAGNDLIITHAGRDILGGGGGDDTLVVDKALGDLATVRLRGGSGDNTAIIVTDDPTLQDFDNTKSRLTLDLGDHQVHLNRIQRVDFMTAEEFAAFKEGFNAPVEADSWAV